MNIAPMTPQQIALNHEIGILGQAAYKAENNLDFPLAEKDAKESMSYGWGSGLGIETFAEASYYQGKDSQALWALKKMHEAGNTDSCETLYAWLLLKTGDVQGAAEAYNRTVPSIDPREVLYKEGQLNPENVNPTRLGNSILADLSLASPITGNGDYDKQQRVGWMEKAMASDPDSPLVNYYYARALQDNERHDSQHNALADEYFQRAAEMTNDPLLKARAQAQAR